MQPKSSLQKGPEQKWTRDENEPDQVKGGQFAEGLEVNSSRSSGNQAVSDQSHHQQQKQQQNEPALGTSFSVNKLTTTKLTAQVAGSNLGSGREFGKPDNKGSQRAEFDSESERKVGLERSALVAVTQVPQDDHKHDHDYDYDYDFNYHQEQRRLSSADCREQTDKRSQSLRQRQRRASGDSNAARLRDARAPSDFGAFNQPNAARFEATKTKQKFQPKRMVELELGATQSDAAQVAASAPKQTTADKLWPVGPEAAATTQPKTTTILASNFSTIEHKLAGQQHKPIEVEQNCLLDTIAYNEKESFQANETRGLVSDRKQSFSDKETNETTRRPIESEQKFVS